MLTLYIIAGCNGAGKTTAANILLPTLFENTEFVNADNIARVISPSNPESVAFEAGRRMLTRIDELIVQRQSFTIETTLATRSLLKMVHNAQQKGYYVTILYFWLNSPDMAVERVAARVRAGGHDIPEETIRRRYTVGLSYFFHTYMPECDKWILADNSEPPFQIVAEGSKKGLLISDMEKYNTIRSLVTKAIHPMRSVEHVAEEIVKEIAKAPVAHDGVPFAAQPTDNDIQ